MKQIARRVVLVFLVFVELWLLTGFLPQHLQQRMYAGIEKRWPSQLHDYTRTTHPALDYELQPFKPIGMALLTGLVIVNGGIIVALWARRAK